MKFNSEESYRAFQEPETIVTEEDFGCGFAGIGRKRKKKNYFS